eukprot:JP448499.1.p3 GENE.JP448499.1~~JP448499.1.p3  ORF type:complete len:86 (+),score=13.05 JP448499.1:55-312(+)
MKFKLFLALCLFAACALALPTTAVQDDVNSSDSNEMDDPAAMLDEQDAATLNGEDSADEAQEWYWSMKTPAPGRADRNWSVFGDH